MYICQMLKLKLETFKYSPKVLRTGIEENWSSSSEEGETQTAKTLGSHGTKGTELNMWKCIGGKKIKKTVI